MFSGFKTPKHKKFKKEDIMGSKSKRIVSIIIFLLGILSTSYTLYLGFTGNRNNMRGGILILGFLLIILGMYFFHTKHHSKIINILFLLPLMLTLIFTVLVPFIYGIFYSFTDWDGIKYSNFVGLKNYIKIFKSIDYIYSFAVTLIYTIANMISINIVAFGLAILCTSKVKGKIFYRASFFLPNLIGGIVLGYIWQFIFNKVCISLIKDSVSMLTDPNLAVLAIIIVSTWQYSGYIMMIYVTGFTTLPIDVLEAAKVDGAGFWHTLFKVKLPMIANTITISILFTLIYSFKQFDLNFAITYGAPPRVLLGKTIPATGFLAFNIYDTAITLSRFSLGQAKAVIFFVILTIVSVVQVSISKKKEIEL